MDNEIDRKIDFTALLFLLVQNRQQTHDWTLIGSGANGLGIQECMVNRSSHKVFKCLKCTIGKQNRILHVINFAIYSANQKSAEYEDDKKPKEIVLLATY